MHEEFRNDLLNIEAIKKDVQNEYNDESKNPVVVEVMAYQMLELILKKKKPKLGFIDAIQNYFRTKHEAEYFRNKIGIKNIPADAKEAKLEEYLAQFTEIQELTDNKYLGISSFNPKTSQFNIKIRDGFLRGYSLAHEMYHLYHHIHNNHEGHEKCSYEIDERIIENDDKLSEIVNIAVDPEKVDYFNHPMPQMATTVVSWLSMMQESVWSGNEVEVYAELFACFMMAEEMADIKKTVRDIGLLFHGITSAKQIKKTDAVSLYDIDKEAKKGLSVMLNLCGPKTPYLSMRVAIMLRCIFTTIFPEQELNHDRS